MIVSCNAFCLQSGNTFSIAMGWVVTTCIFLSMLVSWFCTFLQQYFNYKSRLAVTKSKFSVHKIKSSKELFDSIKPITKEVLDEEQMTQQISCDISKSQAISNLPTSQDKITRVEIIEVQKDCDYNRRSRESMDIPSSNNIADADNSALRINERKRQNASTHRPSIELTSEKLKQALFKGGRKKK